MLGKEHQDYLIKLSTKIFTRRKVQIKTLYNIIYKHIWSVFTYTTPIDICMQLPLK